MAQSGENLPKNEILEKKSTCSEFGQFLSKSSQRKSSPPIRGQLVSSRRKNPASGRNPNLFRIKDSLVQSNQDSKSSFTTSQFLNSRTSPHKGFFAIPTKVTEENTPNEEK
jgi:hypothetical protein